MAQVARIAPSLPHRNPSRSHRLPDRLWSRLPAVAASARTLASTVGRSAQLTHEVLAPKRAREQAGERAEALAENDRRAGSRKRRSVAPPTLYEQRSCGARQHRRLNQDLHASVFSLYARWRARRFRSAERGRGRVGRAAGVASPGAIQGSIVSRRRIGCGDTMSGRRRRGGPRSTRRSDGARRSPATARQPTQTSLPKP
jgi:hypothetical protein